MLEEKRHAHMRFWKGEGPSLILIPADRAELYDTVNYPQRFRDPRLMWESEIRRTQDVMDWPTDGIPTVRPNLGVVFVPAIAGQDYRIEEGQMPWPGAALSEDAIRAIRHIDETQADLMQYVASFYAIHKASGKTEVAAYHPDTEGVFDAAHLLYGDTVFCDLLDETRASWIEELMDIVVDLYVRVSHHIKQLMGEDVGSMIHGHGTPQGVYFPHAGVRVSEDTATLVSPQTIEQVIMPQIERAIAPFGGTFVHYCGRHEPLFEQFCRCSLVRAIDVQPGMHDTRWLLERCAETGTVLYSRLEGRDDEQWPDYVRRLATLVKETGARLILRPEVYPSERSDCAAMQDLWHELTE